MYSPKIKETLKGILDKFESGVIPEAVAVHAMSL